MKKSLVAAVVSAAVMLPIGAQAESELTVYGHVHNGIVSKSYEDAQPDGTAKDTTTDVNTNGSRFGFNAIGDLGNGLNALAKLRSVWCWYR